jgi:hypothetical protein
MGLITFGLVCGAAFDDVACLESAPEAAFVLRYALPGMTVRTSRGGGLKEGL